MAKDISIKILKTHYDSLTKLAKKEGRTIKGQIGKMVEEMTKGAK